MTNQPLRTEVQRLRQWCGPATPAGVGPGRDSRERGEVDKVVAQLDPIRSRTSLLSSFAREASPSEPVRTAYAIRWLELGPSISATGIARSRGRRVLRPLLRGRS